MPIDLAPHHKRGLPVANPVLLAGGTIGAGEALLGGADEGVQTARLGAVVVGPILRHSRAGSEPPRLGETVGGFVLGTGLQNRGVSAAVRKLSAGWARLGCPVVAQVADSQPDALAETVERLGRVESLAGLELLVSPHQELWQVTELVETATSASDLPLWVKLPLDYAADWAEDVYGAGAVGLVVGQPLPGAALHASTGQPVTGALHGPAAFAPMLRALLAVAKLRLPCALIACGGIYTIEQARQALNAGADALQIDSAIWAEPGLAAVIAESLKQEI